MSPELPSLADEAQSKVEEYSRFVEGVLRPEMKEAKRKVEDVLHEVSEYQQLGAALQEIQEVKGFESNPQVDLGHQTVYCPAKINKNSKIFVNLGLGFHVELEILEALKFVDDRTDFLRNKVLPHHREKLIQVESHFQSSLNILEELEKVQKMV